MTGLGGSVAPMGDVVLRITLLSRSIPESVNECRKGRRRIPAAGIVEVIASECRAPLRKHPSQPPVLDMLQDEVRRNVCETNPVQCCINCGGDVAQCELAVHTHAELAVATLELPGVKTA